MKKWIALIVSVATLAGCGGQSSPPEKKGITVTKTVAVVDKKPKENSLNLTPSQLKSALSNWPSEVTLSNEKTGKDKNGKQFVLYDYERAGKIKAVLASDGNIREITALCGYGRTNHGEGTTDQLAKLALGLVLLENPDTEQAQKTVTDLLIQGEKQSGKMQKVNIGNIRYGITVMRGSKMAMFVLIPAGEEWPSEVKQKKS